MTDQQQTPSLWHRRLKWLKQPLSSLLGAIAFYTCLPIPARWPLNFTGIAVWAPLVGLGIGGLLSLLDASLLALGMDPPLLRSALVVALWIGVTGGLHLDGAMDTADGLAVLDPQRRLDVMADSRSGAFGVMAAIVIVGLKTTALSEIATDRWVVLLAAAGWGRWGQLVAIACYPYLRAAGKGAFHKAAIHSWRQTLLPLALLLALSSLLIVLQPETDIAAILLASLGLAIALLTGAWFNHKLGGHTGDTYGAVVEWTETLLLCGASLLF